MRNSERSSTKRKLSWWLQALRCDATSGKLIEIKLCCGTTYSIACHSTGPKQPFSNLFSQLCNIIHTHNSLLVATYTRTRYAKSLFGRNLLTLTLTQHDAVRELHFNLFLQAQLCYENGNFVKLFCCIISPFCYSAYTQRFVVATTTTVI